VKREDLNKFRFLESQLAKFSPIHVRQIHTLSINSVSIQYSPKTKSQSEKWKTKL